MKGGIGRVCAAGLLLIVLLNGTGEVLGVGLLPQSTRNTSKPTGGLSQDDQKQLVSEAIARTKAYLLQQGHSVSRYSAPVVYVEQGAAVVHFDAFSDKEQLFKVSIRFSGHPGQWTLETIGVLTGEH